MARIPDSEIERLKNEVSVERLVESSGIALKKAGKDLLGCCPFHADDTASLVVTPAKNLCTASAAASVVARSTGSLKRTACPSATRWNCCVMAFLLSPIRGQEPPGLSR